MATKIVCDGCGEEIKQWKPGDSDHGFSRSLVISTGQIRHQWDLCNACQGRVANALVELLPVTPREAWFDAIRPAKRTTNGY